MYTYHWYQWLLFFYIYCIIGWCFESTYVSFLKKHWVNRGFLRLPMLPIYGFGAITMLLAAMPVRDYIPLTFLFGMIGATILEYVTGVVMEALFKVRYWDYSKQKFNFRGHICLSSSITWGAMTVLLVRVLHKPVEDVVLGIQASVNIGIVIFVSAIFLTDVVMSCISAWDLRKLLEKMTLLKEEIEDLEEKIRQMSQDRFMKVAELTGDMKESIRERSEDVKESIRERSEDVKDTIRERTEEVKETLKVHTDEVFDTLRETSERIKERAVNVTDSLTKEGLMHRMQEIKDEYKGISEKKSFFRTSLIKGNPSASSKKFSGAWDDLKKRLKKDENE